MNAVKKICNFFGILLAWVLSIAFIAVLVAAPITLTLLSAVQPKKASEMVSYIDTSAVDLSKFLPLEQEEKELTAAVQELFNSDATKKVVELYMTDVYNALTGEETETLLTADALADVETNIWKTWCGSCKNTI